MSAIRGDATPAAAAVCVSGCGDAARSRALEVLRVLTGVGIVPLELETPNAPTLSPEIARAYALARVARSQCVSQCVGCAGKGGWVGGVGVGWGWVVVGVVVVVVVVVGGGGGTPKPGRADRVPNASVPIPFCLALLAQALTGRLTVETRAVDPVGVLQQLERDDGARRQRRQRGQGQQKARDVKGSAPQRVGHRQKQILDRLQAVCNRKNARAGGIQVWDVSRWAQCVGWAQRCAYTPSAVPRRSGGTSMATIGQTAHATDEYATPSRTCVGRGAKPQQT